MKRTPCKNGRGMGLIQPCQGEPVQTGIWNDILALQAHSAGDISVEMPPSLKEQDGFLRGPSLKEDCMRLV